MSVPLTNDRLLRALKREPVDRTPIWIMRQAGRYLPEYKKTKQRAGGDFMTLCKTPELACEVTLQPLERFPLDAAILFSDILTIPDAMGLGLYFKEHIGPQFSKPLRTEADIYALSAPDPMVELRYVIDTVTITQQELAGKVPLIGFSGSPWTLATYMIEGGPSKDFSKIKALMYDTPTIMHQLLTTLTQSIILYLRAQIKAGVQAIMIFDTWGGILTTPCYLTFSLEYMSRIISELKAESVPVILFTKGGGHWVESIATSGCDAIGIDWTVEIGKIRQKIGNQVALQGNLDPCVLYADESTIRRAVADILADFGKGTGHIFNLGHGIQQHTKPENVAILVDAVHKESQQYHNDSI